jgi:hypothetical protein
MKEFWDVDSHVTSPKVFERLVSFYKQKGKNRSKIDSSYCIARGELAYGFAVYSISAFKSQNE